MFPLPLYWYQAFTPYGFKVSDTRAAQCPASLYQALLGEGQLLIRYRLLSGPLQTIQKYIFSPFFQGQRLSQGPRLALLFDMLAAFLAVGKPLQAALGHFLTPSIKSGLSDLQPFIFRIKTHIGNGHSFSNAFEKACPHFPPLYTHILHLYEQRGDLAGGVKSLAQIHRQRLHSQKQWQQALRYPLAIFLMMIGLLYGLITILLPQLLSLLKSFDLTPSPLLEWAAQGGLQSIFIYLTSMSILLFCLLIGARLISSIAEYKVSQWSLRLPGWGQWIKKHTHSIFLDTVALALESHIQLTTALKLSTGGIRNFSLRKDFENLQPFIEKGHSLTQALQKYSHLSPFLLP